jgi:GTP cyclohydrolase I
MLEIIVDLPDIQETVPEIREPIQRVGVDNVELPFLLLLRDGSPGYIQVNAMTEMVCYLNESTRGVSMSRFTRILQPYLRKPIKRESLEHILRDFTKSLKTDAASIKFTFKMPMNKKSPLSDNEFPQFYQCSFKSVYTEDRFQFYESVRVQYAAYCPCSAALCQEGKFGYPHNQRAFADVIVRTSPRAYVWLEDLVELVEKSVKTIPYPIIKRSDEKWVAGIAKSYPQFVEDSIREISHQLHREKHIIDWFVKCTHEESIHPSNAIAMNWKGIINGFNEMTYI